MRSRRALFAFALSTTLLACMNPRAKAPAAQPGMHAPPIAASVLTVPISIDIEPVRAEILAKAPKPLEAGASRVRVPAHIKITSPMTIGDWVEHTITEKAWQKVPTVVKVAGCVATAANACTETVMTDKQVTATRQVREYVERKVGKSDDELTTVELELTHQADLSDVKLSVAGDRMTLDATIRVSASGKTDPSFPAPLVGTASCAAADAAAELRLSLSGKVAWTQDGAISFAAEPWQQTWVHPCKLTAFETNLDELLKLPATHAYLEGKLSEALEELPASTAVTDAIDQAWNDLDQPRQVVGGEPALWALVRPDSASIYGLSGSGAHLSTTLFVTGAPMVTPSYAPPPWFGSPLPPIQIGRRQPTIHVEMDAEAPWSALDAALTRDVAVVEREMGPGHAVGISRGRIYGHGDRLVLGVTISQPFRGEVFLYARPVFDVATHTVSLEQLEFADESKALLREVNNDWIQNDTFRAYVREKAKLDIGEYLTRANSVGRRLTLPAGSSGSVQIDLGTVRPRQIYATESGLHVLAVADGKAQFHTKAP